MSLLLAGFHSISMPLSKNKASLQRLPNKCFVSSWLGVGELYKGLFVAKSMRSLLLDQSLSYKEGSCCPNLSNTIFTTQNSFVKQLPLPV